MSPELLRSLVWTDFRLAVLFCVLMPLGLLVWSVVKNAKSITHLLMIYWRVSSLLAITVYLLMAQNPIGFMTGFVALVLIPVSLWFWIDLNEEIEDRRGLLKLAVNAWRWATTIYCIAAAVVQAPYLKCATLKTALLTAECQAWLEPPRLYQSIFHAATKAEKLGFLAIIALLFYGFYLVYFVIFKFTKQGRIATES
jgi:Protein of unknown function (DUF3177)